jgi:hypothetical protein
MAEDVSKLPRWARDKIHALERELQTERQLVRAMGGLPDSSNVSLARSYPMTDLPLQANSVIRFGLEDRVVEVGHAGSQDPRGWLTVRASHGVLLAMPAASNVLYVKSSLEKP